MALTRIVVDEIAARPTGESPLNYMRDCLIAGGWVEDKTVYDGAWVQEIYFHSTHATEPIFISAQSSAHIVDTVYQHVWWYTQLGFDTGLAVDQQPNGLTTTLNPPSYNSVLFAWAGRVSFDCFINSECVYFSFFEGNLINSATVDRYERGTRQNVYMAGTITPYMSFSGGQFARHGHRSGEDGIAIYDSFYFEGNWYNTNVNAVNGLVCGTRVHDAAGAAQRTGNLRTGGIILFPYVQYVDTDPSTTNTLWTALGEWPFVYYQRYGTVWNKLIQHEGRDYFSKVAENPSNRIYYLFDITP